jgi:hypothetical protein
LWKYGALSKTPMSDGGLKPSPPNAVATVSAGSTVFTGLMALLRTSIGFVAAKVPSWRRTRMRSVPPVLGGGTSQIRPAPAAEAKALMNTPVAMLTMPVSVPGTGLTLSGSKVTRLVVHFAPL